jgi:uncharacterized protein YjiK
MSNYFLIAFLSLLLPLISPTGVEKKVAHPKMPYDLEQPIAVFEMPESLKEISGLGMTENLEHLTAVNDEEGIVFLINKRDGKIVKEITFWDDGDYEGLEVIGDDIYIIKSSGTIYHVRDYLSDKPSTVKIKTFLNQENDVEGLACDRAKNCLLVGCKGKIAEGETEQPRLKKAIYQFDLGNMTMKNEPAFMLTLPDIQEYISHMEEHGEMEKLLEDFSHKEDELKFSPSGIAVHPITREIYVTSSKGKLLLVLSSEGKIVHLIKLKKKIHAQPEGICFDADGTLYIANEGKDDKAVVYKFPYLN